MRLTAFERKATRAIFEAILPGTEDGLPAAAEHDLLAVHVEFLAAMPAVQRLGFRCGAVAAALAAPLLMMGRPCTLLALAPAEREVCLARLLGHRSYPVRQLGLLLKVAACMAYFQIDDVRATYGLPPVKDPGGAAPALPAQRPAPPAATAA
jgi:hypothetical protein